MQIKERDITQKFKQELIRRYPNDILDVILFGSNARGNATKKSDIDILVITKSNNWKRVDQIREIGYDMDDEIDYKFSIQVLPKSHIDYLRSKEPLAKVSLTAHHSILDAQAILECCMRCRAHRIHTPKSCVSQKRLMPNGLRRMHGIFIR